LNLIKHVILLFRRTRRRKLALKLISFIKLLYLSLTSRADTEGHIQRAGAEKAGKNEDSGNDQ